MVKLCENIAVIPARGGSKRIPHKNIIEFCGKPMLAFTILAAQESKLFDRIIVSTDDEDIAKVAEQYGVEVPFFRNRHNDDYTPVSEATIFSVEQASMYYQEVYQNVIQLMANCPLRTADDILAAYRNFKKHDFDFQLSCFKFGWMNPWWAVKLKEDYTPYKLFDVSTNKRSQDLESLYCPTGAIWIAKAEKLKQYGTFYGKNYKMFPISVKSAIDIDDYDDLEMATYFAQSVLTEE